MLRGGPHVHDLAYGPAVDRKDHPLLQQAAIAYWGLLHDAVAACQAPGTSEEEVLSRSPTVWGATYGIARLAIFRQIPTSVSKDADDLVSAALDALIPGWHTQPGWGQPNRQKRNRRQSRDVRLSSDQGPLAAV